MCFFRSHLVLLVPQQSMWRCNNNTRLLLSLKFKNACDILLPNSTSLNHLICTSASWSILSILAYGTSVQFFVVAWLFGCCYCCCSYGLFTCPMTDFFHARILLLPLCHRLFVSSSLFHRTFFRLISSVCGNKFGL